jgi:Arc/MetJ-type ribon-helix-helix transcriptional regulator
MSKQRLSATVDEELVKAAENAVSRGASESVSSWVNDALRLKLAHDRRLEALADFVAAYEAEHGEITPEEMQLAARRAREAAVSVRGARSGKPGKLRRRRTS